MDRKLSGRHHYGAVRRHSSGSAAEREEVIAGYRVIRLLGSGNRANVYLGHTDSGTAVALKVFHTHADSASIESDIAILTSAAVPGLVRLLDVARVADGRICLVLERLAGGSLARYLIEHPRLHSGEAVTVLAPIVVSLRGLHEAGFTHGSLSPAVVLLDATGRAVLTGFGASQKLNIDSRECQAQVRADWGRLSLILAGVFDAVDEVPEPTQGTVAVLVRFQRCIDLAFKLPERGVANAPCVATLSQLEHDLFDWANAVPLQAFQSASQPSSLSTAVQHRDGGGGGDGDTSQRSTVPPLRTARHSQNAGPLLMPETNIERSSDGDLGGQFEDEVVKNAGVRRSSSVIVNSTEALFGLARWGGNRVLSCRRQISTYITVSALLDAHPLQNAAHRVRKRLHGRRRVLLFAALLSSAALVLALTLFPAPGQAGNSPAPFPQRGSEPAGASPEIHTSDTTTSVPRVDDPRTTPEETPEERHSAAPKGETVLMGNEPVEALRELLERRANCLATASLVCLDTVDQAGSAMMTLDTSLIRERQNGGGTLNGPDYRTSELSLAEHTGNLAIVQLTPIAAQQQGQPPSVLVIKGEDGWRLRDIFDY